MMLSGKKNCFQNVKSRKTAGGEILEYGPR